MLPPMQCAVTLIDPMTRGLKAKLFLLASACALFVTLIDPMTRGLKVSNRRNLRGEFRIGVTLIDPMTRGLKVAYNSFSPYWFASRLH